MLKIRAKGLLYSQNMAKVENFQLFQKFTKISIYTKNDEMNIFGEFQLKITPGSAKTVTPYFCENPQKLGV